MKTAVVVPTINANDDSVVLIRWHVADGGRVEAGAPLADVETTKAVVAIEAETAGWVRHSAKEGAEIAVGAPLAWVFSEQSESAAAESASPDKVEEGHPNPPAFSATRLSPAAEKLAAEKGIDPSSLGAGLGLITRTALQALLERGTGILPVSDETAGVAPALLPPSDPRRRERVPPSKRAEIQALRAGAGEGLKSSLTIYLDSAGARAAAAERGGAFLPLVLAELAALLAEHPRFTAFHEAGATVFHDAVHLGVAVDLGGGLRLVTLRDAAGQDAAALERRLAELTLDVIENNLALADAQGATFAVSDLSGFDIMQFEPLLNERQAAILGIGGDATLPGHPVSLTLAFDHRVLGGREVAVFLQALRDRILAHATPEPAACDRCLIDVPSYYAKFGQVGVMHHYTRPDGSTGLICHACLASF